MEARQLREWLEEIQGFVTLFDRVLRALSRAETDEIARGFAVLARISDETLDNLLRLFGSLPEDELAETCFDHANALDPDHYPLPARVDDV